jgi:predicted DNA-binding transcriptional regulator YafY
MSQRKTLGRYNLILKKLRRGYASFKEIQDYLARESEIQSVDFHLSERSFFRDKNEILSLYNIDIQFDRSRNAYHIAKDNNEDYSSRILESFDVFNTLNISERLTDYIHFESRKSGGTEHLSAILHAIKNQIKLQFTYQKYTEERPTERTVEPYALKEYQHRWYLIAKDCPGKKIKSFSLDRIQSIEIGSEKFERSEDFNLEKMYQYSFGVINSPNTQPDKIILSFTPFQGKYVKNLALHHSQTPLIDTDKEYRISLEMHITHDFIMELLSLGDQVQVISPESLINDIRDRHKQAYLKYLNV